MHSIITKILMSLFLLVSCATQLQAQEEELPAPVEEITTDTVVALPDSELYSEEEETYTSDDTLYFNSKDYPGIYDSTQLTYRSVPDSVIKALKADPDFWYADKAKKKKEQKNKDINLGFLERLFRFLADIENLLWIVLGLIVFTALVWFLSNNKINIFGRGRRKLITTDVVINEQLMQPEDLQVAISNAVAHQNYRLAVRLQYIYLLKKMAESGQIKFKEDATNMEYLTQVYGKPYYKDFFTVTRHYEYVWYGEMPIDATAYKTVEAGFNSLLNHPALQS